MCTDTETQRDTQTHPPAQTHACKAPRERPDHEALQHLGVANLPLFRRQRHVPPCMAVGEDGVEQIETALHGKRHVMQGVRGQADLARDELVEAGEEDGQLLSDHSLVEQRVHLQPAVLDVIHSHAALWHVYKAEGSPRGVSVPHVNILQNQRDVVPLLAASLTHFPVRIRAVFEHRKPLAPALIEHRRCGDNVLNPQGRHVAVEHQYLVPGRLHLLGL